MQEHVCGLGVGRDRDRSIEAFAKTGSTPAVLHFLLLRASVVTCTVEAFTHYRTTASTSRLAEFSGVVTRSRQQTRTNTHTYTHTHIGLVSSSKFPLTSEATSMVTVCKSSKLHVSQPGGCLGRKHVTAGTTGST